MKRALKKQTNVYYYYDNYGKRVDGVHDRIRGDVSDITGDVSGIRGDVSGIWGNVDECGLSEDDRKRGVRIEDLIEN